MKFTFAHNNLNVLDLEKSVKFYQSALGLVEISSYTAPDGSFRLVFLGDGQSSHQLELTWLRDRKEPYELGDNEVHLAFVVDDYNAAKERHRQMQCISFENDEMNLYFIEDPDGYWIEIIPQKVQH